MRIPFDLIAAFMCVEGIERYLRGTGEGECQPALSLSIALAAWLGFLLCTWLLHELLGNGARGLVFGRLARKAASIRMCSIPRVCG